MCLVECFKEELPCPRVKMEPGWMTGCELASFRKKKRRGMPVSPGASGMQPRDPCRPWRGTLASGHKPR